MISGRNQQNEPIVNGSAVASNRCTKLNTSDLVTYIYWKVFNTQSSKTKESDKGHFPSCCRLLAIKCRLILKLNSDDKNATRVFKSRYRALMCGISNRATRDLPANARHCALRIINTDSVQSRACHA